MKNKVRMVMGAGLAGVMAVTVLPEPASADPASDEAQFVAQLNHLRATRGLAPLAVHGALVGMARSWSSQMASSGNISHNPGMAAQAPGNWARLGENVGMGASVGSLHNAFVASPNHYANMVNVHYDSVGVGVVQKGATKFVTFNFMTTQAAPPAAAVAAPRFAPPPPAPRTVCRRRRRRVVCRRAGIRRVARSRRGRVGRARRAGRVRGARRR